MAYAPQFFVLLRRLRDANASRFVDRGATSLEQIEPTSIQLRILGLVVLRPHLLEEQGHIGPLGDLEQGEWRFIEFRAEDPERNPGCSRYLYNRSNLHDTW